METTKEGTRISGKRVVVREIAADQMGAGCFKATDEYDGDPPYHGGVQCGSHEQADTHANGVQFGQAPDGTDFFVATPPR
mmetsp:Transcript_3294/g.5289  ORF Transcript_3294/g.5289 Transcript_3294/m.5289 type:complete len:80 (+) Transcript_3294:2-241(+)